MSENRKIKFTTNKGVFVAEMFEDKAPLTTKNFIELVEKGFYDGIIFHRVIDGFMIHALKKLLNTTTSSSFSSGIISSPAKRTNSSSFSPKYPSFFVTIRSSALTVDLPNST